MSDDVDSDVIHTSLRSISRGASIGFAGKLISTILGFVINLLLTRGLGAALYGIYSYGKSILSIILIFSQLGTGQSVMRFLPEYDDNINRQNEVLGLAYFTALVSSIIIGVILYLLAPIVAKYTLGNPLLTDVLRILAIILPFNTLANLSNKIFISIERINYNVFVKDIITPTLRIIFIGGALLLGYSLLGVLAAVALASAVILIIALIVLFSKTQLRPTTNTSFNQKVEFYRFSVPLSLKDVGSTVQNRVDILMVGFFLTESTVGIYRVAVLLSSVLVLPLGMFSQLFPPVASRLYANDEKQELESVYSIVTRWTLTIVLVPALSLIIYRQEILAIFGDEFTTGSVVVVFFAIAQITNSAVGPSGFILMMTDNQYLSLINAWSMGILNIVLNYIFILEFGLVGAAMATATVMAGINIIRIIEIWYVEDLFPYDLSFWKPLAAGTVVSIQMFALEILLDDYLLVAVGSISGFFLFCGLLISFGIDPNDREFLNRIIEELF